MRALVERLGHVAAQACSLEWVTNEGVCRSLQAKTDAAARSIERDADAARRQISAFIAELDAQHGPEPGKHVNDNAYWLLRINAEYILAQM
jgi:hypothetical protein